MLNIYTLDDIERIRAAWLAAWPEVAAFARRPRRASDVFPHPVAGEDVVLQSEPTPRVIDAAEYTVELA